MKIPYHPLFLHFPIAFYFLELLLLFFWTVKKDPAFQRFSLFVFRLGYSLMLVTLITGWMDSGGWKNIKGDLREHFIAAIILFVFYTGRAIYWRFGNREGENYPKVLLVTALIGTIILTVTGYFGGELVYGG